MPKTNQNSSEQLPTNQGVVNRVPITRIAFSVSEFADAVFATSELRRDFVDYMETFPGIRIDTIVCTLIPYSNEKANS